MSKGTQWRKRVSYRGTTAFLFFSQLQVILIELNVFRQSLKFTDISIWHCFSFVIAIWWCIHKMYLFSVDTRENSPVRWHHWWKEILLDKIRMELEEWVILEVILLYHFIVYYYIIYLLKDHALKREIYKTNRELSTNGINICIALTLFACWLILCSLFNLVLLSLPDLTRFHANNKIVTTEERKKNLNSGHT